MKEENLVKKSLKHKKSLRNIIELWLNIMASSGTKDYDGMKIIF